MTVPAVPPGRTARHTHERLPFPETPQAATPAALKAALAAGVSAPAVKLLAALVVEWPAGHEWLELDDIADAAGMTLRAAVPPMGELVEAGLVQRRRITKVVDGKKRDRNRYMLAVTR